MRSIFKYLAIASVVVVPLFLAGQSARSAVPLLTNNICTPDQIVACVNNAINGVNSNATTYGYGAVPFANLPACTAQASVGLRSIISNGPASPVWNAAAAGGGAVYTPVLCSQTGAATFAWVNS